MALLRLYHQGQKLRELELDPSREYFAGRSPECDFLMKQERGISRQHIKIAFENDAWHVTLLSRFGGLKLAGESVEVIRLDTDARFAVPPFEFEFIYEAAQTNAPDPRDTPLPVEEKSSDAEPAYAPAEAFAHEAAPLAADNEAGNFDATQVGAVTLVPFLKIRNRSNGSEEVLKLEGHVWTAGRHPSSEIVINDGSISRKHFEIKRTNEGFYITDLHSSNGTLVNEENIVPDEPHPLRSGDVIRIRNIQITFEIRDVQFEQKLRNLPAPAEIYDVNEDEPDNLVDAEQSELSPSVNGPAVIRLPPQEATGSNWKQHKMKVAIAALAVILMAGYFFMEETPAPVSDDGSSSLGSEKEISPEQLKVLEDKYNLAIKHHESGKYTLCRDLLMEIHSVVPSIGDSQNLQRYCEQGIELTQINRDREMKEQKRAEAEAKIRMTVENCKSQMSDTITYEQMQECLTPALELDPQNAAAQDLLTNIKIRDEKREAEAERAREIASLKSQGRSHFRRAVELEKQGRLRSALNQYTNFLQKNYPGMKDEEEQARRAIASIRQNIDKKVASLIGACKGHIERSEFKPAKKACEDALKEDPNNGEAKELKERLAADMKRTFKSIYEDSVLEESLGNVEGAKEKWRQILKDSFPGEEYYDKAQSRLKRYEGG